jgi:hypothetical protein
MEIYNNSEQAILEALGEFQFLTSTQLVRLGRAGSRWTVWKNLNRLINTARAPVARMNYPANPSLGRLDSIHYLTPFGVRLLEGERSDREDVKAPRRVGVVFTSDYSHRIGVIDFFIALKMWAEKNGFETAHKSFYFEQKTGSNRNNKGGKSLSDNRLDIDKNGVSYIIPDGVAIVSRGEEKPFFLLMEQHNGKDTKRFMRQAYGHTLAIGEGLPSLKFGVKHQGEYIANRVFCVFENPACMQASMYRLAKNLDFDFTDVEPFFLFKTLDAMQNTTFETGWQYANGRMVEIR